MFRVARFAAQLPGFSVADDTQALLRHMCRNGELETLSAERVWQEFVKALTAPNPGDFSKVLEACEGLLIGCQSAGRSSREKLWQPPRSCSPLRLCCQYRQSLAASYQARLRGPNRYAALAADRHAYLAMLEQWPY